MKHINLIQMLQGCSKRNGMTVSASGSDGAQTSEVKRQTLSSKNEKWSKNEALHSTCLRSASDALSYCPHYLSRIAVILCILVMSMANVGTAWAYWYLPGTIHYNAWGNGDNQMNGDNTIVFYAVPAGTYYFKLSNGTSQSGHYILSSYSGSQISSTGTDNGQTKITLSSAADLTFHVTNEKTWMVSVVASAPSYMIKYPWNGGSWGWSMPMTDNGDGTYSCVGKYGGISYNKIKKTQNHDTGDTGTATKEGSISNGNMCVFTYTASTGALFIRKTNSIAYTNHFYFDNTNAEWSETHTYFVIGRPINDASPYSTMYGDMNQISNTNLWYSSNGSDNWTDAAYFAIAGGSSAWDSKHDWGPTALSGWAKHSAPCYTALSMVNGGSYVVTKADGSNGGAISVTRYGSSTGYGALNNLKLVFKYALSTNGGSTYSDMSSGKTPGKITMDWYKFSAVNAVTAQTQKKINAGGTSSYSNYAESAGYRTETTLEVSDLQDGYEFVGWYDGDMEKSKATTYTYYPAANCTIAARFKTVLVTSITLNKTSTTLTAGGDTETLSVSSVSPSNALDKTVTWSTSNSSVATVNSSGVVTPKAAGSATITATAHDGSGVKATCTVTVNPPVAYSVTYNLNGGLYNGSSTAPTQSDITSGSSFSMPSLTPTKSGYVFAGWKSSANNNYYGPSASYTMTATNTTLTAQWATCVGTLDLAAYSAAMGTRNLENTRTDLTSRNVIHSLGGSTTYDNSNNDDGYHGLKFKNSGDWIGFGVAAGSTVTIEFETVGTSPNFYIDFAKQAGKTASTGGSVDFTSAGTNRYFRIEAADGKSTVVKKITITAACTTPTIAWSASPADGNVGGNRTISVTSNYPAGVTIASNNSNATLSERTVAGSIVSYTLSYAVAGNANITASVDGDGSTVCDETVNLGAVAITISKNTPTSYTVSGGGSYCPGAGTVTLSDSQEDISYQLYRDDAKVGEAVEGTGSELTWADLSIAGTYTVKTIANDAYNAATMTGSAVITFKTNTAIETQPTSIAKANVDEEQTLSVVATGSNLEYQWYSCSDAEKTGATILTGETGDELSVTPEDAGVIYYYCVVSGDCGAPVTSNVVSITAKNAISPTLTYNAYSVAVGSTLTATLDKKGSDGSVTYESSDDDVATVASDGTVTGVSAGTVTITATIADGTSHWGNTATSGTITVSAPTYTVTYVYNGATGGDDTPSATCASVTLPTPTKTGYTLDGWYTTAGAKVDDGGETYSPTADITLYARWTKTCSSGSTTTWDFSDRSESSFTSGSSYSFTATDGETEMRYTAGSSEGIVAKTEKKTGYLKENGNTGGGSYTDVDGKTAIAKNRLIRLFVGNGSGTLRINCTADHSGTWKVLDGSASGSTLIASLAMNTTSSSITVANSLLWIETTAKGYITSIVWTTGSGGSCRGVYYHGNGAESGYVYDPKVYDDGDDPVVLGNTTGTNGVAFVKDGYTFQGWATSAGGSVVYTAGDEIENIDDDVDLYAVWAEEVACSTDPTVTAGSNGSVTSTTATVSCESGISSLGTGGCTITSYGFVIGTSTNPVIGGVGVTQHVVGTSYASTGASFSKDLTGLTEGTTYYVRPYATNSHGTAYGTQTSFTTSAAPAGAPVITDQPDLSEVALGGTASFSLTATGATSYQWYNCDSEGENKTEVSGATEDNYSYTTTVTGTTYYICKVSNANGDTWSDVVGSIVNPATFTVKYTAGADDGKTYDLAGGANDFTQGHEAVSEVADKFSNWSNYTFTGVGISSTGKKGTMSMLISMPTAYDADKYVSFHFDLAANYQLQLTNVNLQVQAKDNDGQSFKFVISDEYGHSYTKEVASLGQTGKLVQIGGDISETTKFVGTITLKLYGWYSSTDYYRLAKEVTITGEVSSLPAPTASWTARPASATVGDGGKTYTLTTDGTNTVAWSITDQSGATDAALSPTSGLTTTLDDYSTAGSLYVQAAVTGDGIHYLSTPATLLRQRVVISAGCVETTLISATLSSCTGTGAVSGTPGGSSAVEFESCESIDGGYKMGKDESYARLTLASGNFEANDEVKITITKASDQGDGALHIYKYADASWTELGSVTAAGAGTYSYTLTETNVSTAFNTIGLYRTGKNQNPYVKALSVVRSSCSASKPTSVTVTASPTGPSYDIDADLTLTVSADNANTYQWYSNSNNTASDGFLLVGETAITYSPSTAIAGTTYYYCVATNTSGSTVSNIIEVTVNSSKTAPTVSWTDTYETPTYGGGGYAVKATVSDASWDGTLTTDMLTASDGVTLTGVSVSGKVITATYGVTETARSPLSFSLTLPETTDYTALAANKEITFTRCGEGAAIETTETKLPVLSAYTTVNNIYRWETADAGWFTLETGASSISSESSSYSGFSYRSKSGKKYVLLYSELDAVKAVRLYVNGTGDNTTLSKVRTGTTYNKYKELEESTDYDFTYSNSSTSIASRENAYIEISFKTNLTANTFVEITLSRNTLYYGVELLTGSTEVGTIDTDISWAAPAPSATVNKYTTDANFRYEAVKASDAASQATLGTISYKSSVPAVATVSATGVVDVLSAGSTTITATLAGSGCYKKATKSYNLVVAEATCTDEAGTITASGTDITIDGNTVTKADACAAVTLTVSGHTGENDGATYQWYKDGVSMGKSYQEKSITVTDNGDYTVEVTNAGVEHCTMPATNTITITGNAISITNIVDEWYVKNGRRTPDIALATIEGTTSYTVNDGSSNITTFAGCGFELRDGILYLKGTQDDGSAPSGLAAGDVTLTITAVNACGDNPTATITIHKQVETDKPSIAFIVDGTKGDPVNNVATAKTSSRPIWIYLSEFFDLTGCNAYWTNNEKLIRQYYSQFDAIVITDDPSTDEKPKSGLKYVNALGTMVDVRPILTMEAYVGKYGASSNWHIGGTPSSPNPRQYELKLQCKDHDIFSDLTTSANFRSEEIDGETYYYVTMVDNSVTPYAGLADDAETGTYPALQGFSAASIKGTGLLGIGTISDGTLQGGVERQDEPTARMMILGIQHQAMAALTSEGKQVIKNAINYLLKTNMEDVNDCSNYFIGGTEGHEQDWHTASNWSSTKVPDASTKARILVPVTISTKVHVAQVDIAVGGRSIRYNSGGTECSGRVTINPTGALIVDGQVRRTTNGRLYTEEELQPTTPADLTIQTNSSAQGALIFDNSDGETQATVVVRSKANKDEGTRNWQYLTSPLQETPVTEFFYGVGTYTYRHCEAEGGWVRYGLGTTFHAFDAIGLTQEDAKDFVFYGPLAPTGEWNLSLTHVRSGNNLFGNSWTAPIDLKALVRNTDIDDSKIELDLAIYNTGTDQKNESGEFVQEDNADNTPGTWHHIPLRLATLDGAGWKGMTVIPAYQAFQLKATAAATLTIDYDKCVRGSESKNYTEPLRSPGHRAAGKSNSDIEALRLAVSDAKGIAYIYLLEGEQFTEEYDNGWELEYKPNSKYGKLYAISPAQGDMMALARPSLEGTMIGFQPGESSEYTITFNETDGYYYLNDLKMEQSTLIQAGESYTFSVEEGESANRFLISSVPFNKPGIVTGVTNPNAEAPKVQKVIYNDKLYIIRGGKVFSADGQLVK